MPGAPKTSFNDRLTNKPRALTPAEIAAKQKDQKAAEEEAKKVPLQQAEERAKSTQPLINIAKTPAPVMREDPAFRDAQIKLMQNYQDRIEGKTPSLAEMQFKQASNTALQKSLGAVRGGTGSNAALAARTAALSTSSMLGNQANESAMLRLKEQQAAQEGLAGLTQAGRSGDFGVLQGNQTAEMQQRGLGAGIYEKILASDVGRQEGAANRATATEVARISKPRQASSPGILESLIPVVVGAGITAATGNPAAGVGAATATGAAMPMNSKGTAEPAVASTPKPNWDVTGGSTGGFLTQPTSQQKQIPRPRNSLLPNAKRKSLTMM